MNLPKEIGALKLAPKNTFPSFWEEVATMELEENKITIGRSVTNPFHFHIFTDQPHPDGGPGSARYDFNVKDDLGELCNQLLKAIKEPENA